MVSIIIAVKNEEKNIGLCLESIARQDTKDWEVLVINHPETSDRTVQIVEQWGFRVFSHGPERSEQRNFGLKMAPGEFVFFIDADMRLSPRVLSQARRKAAEGFDALVVPEVSVGQGFWTACLALEKKLYLRDPLIEAPRFFRKEVISKVGGYTPGLVSGEDWDLRDKICRQGGRVGRIEAVLFHDEGRASLVGILSKKLYYARRSRKYLSQNPLSPVSLLKFVFRPSFLRNLSYLFLDPVHFLGLIFLKTLEFGVGFYGLVTSEKQ